MDFILSSLIFSPLLAALVLLLMPARLQKPAKVVALLGALVQMVLAIVLYFRFDGTAAANGQQGYQFVEKLNWIGFSLGSLGRFQIEYFVGVDGISISMVLLTGIIGVIGVISSWTIKKNVKGYFLLYLLLLTSVMGCFLALDFFLFYLFFEFMLLPMYFLIGIWGGPKREYAAIKFFIYTLVGSLFILIVMIGLYTSVIDPLATAAQLGMLQTSGINPDTILQVQQSLQQNVIEGADLVRTFSIPAMMDPANFIPGSLLHVFSGTVLWDLPIRFIAFLLLFAGFAIKVPSVPVHTWLPDAHVEAPTPISVLLAAILLKVGGYGLIRIVYPIFPDAGAYFAVLVGGLGVLSIIYGALCALAMNDLKKLIAYSSVSHMGFVLLGLASLTSEGVNGAIYMMFSHGIISAMLFLVVGVIYDRAHDRMILNFRGLAKRMPAYTTFVVIAFFASLGLPGFSGFIAELLVLVGGFSSPDITGLLPRWLTIVAVFGLLLAAAYYLWALQRMFFGKYWIFPELREKATMSDLNRREYLMLVPLAILAFLFGIFPHLLLDKIGMTAQGFTELVLRSGQEQLNMVLSTIIK
ncbi:NADH-quinone oxidoreductase subunit M [Pontibacter sp. BT310]|uniref:NADH-quinone oxidoreductase subunit M n=1 Tax=Pontibacter populi TaxID=890055 RepID=A0ABS6X6A7_9BACT|nr:MULTISPECIES: NADH-quinone oxidoreductase subunit M [Pontibacter]MBJ6116670.1 NADH-quinone oxidoreductase subunit M [Pontibacter sp. BT310]MBR0569094.1 NADH-quinone oxidoreductase subunit M [Microvirga sp. STS03]MBW3363524.1 NADH-quinone oxidoreductase subunit M [Pontibacter populi]